MASTSVRSAAYKYPQAAQRYLIVGWMRRLAQTTQHPDTYTANRLFDQVYRHLEGYARPALVAQSEPASRVAEIMHRPVPDGLDPRKAEALRRHRRWQTVRWWVEGWWREGILGADPRSAELTAEDLIQDDPEAGTHYRAQNAYRTLVLEADGMLGDVALTEDRDLAARLYDRAYEYVHAVAHPVVERIPEVRRELSSIWADHVPGEPVKVTRARRMDSVPCFIRAWHRSSVMGRPVVPVDRSTEESLRGLVPRELEWLEEVR